MSLFGISSDVIGPIAAGIVVFGMYIGVYIGMKTKNIKKACLTVLMYMFGGIFVGIGVSPSNGAPYGVPGMVYIGLLLLIAGFLMTIFAIIPHKLQGKISNRFKGKIGIIALVITVVVITIGLIIGFSISPSDEFGTGSNTCNMCGRSFEAGDIGGNYINISKTGMCNNCYSNYKWIENNY